MRGVSEFIAILIIIVVSVAASILFSMYVSSLITSSQPHIKYLEASVVNVDEVLGGTEKKVYIDSSTFTAYYMYQVDIVIRNIGDKTIQNIQYQVIGLTSDIDICTGDTCKVYDPIALAERYANLPTTIGPNQAVKIKLVVLSKVNLASLGYSPFLIKVTGNLPDGSRVSTYINIWGENTR